MRHIWNTLIQPNIDYCSQLWMPIQSADVCKIEKLLKDFSSKIPELRNFSYWDRLKALKHNSMQRRFERYRIIYVWKTLEGKVPNSGIEVETCKPRGGRKCKVPVTNLKSSKHTQ